MAQSCYREEELRSILNTCVEQYEVDGGLPERIIDSFKGYKLFEVINQCRIYPKSKKIIVITQEKIYIIPFKKIIGYNAVDLVHRGKPLYSATTTTSKTDTGDMIKRAVIGGLLAGDVGAVIGGTTAKRTQSTSKAEEYASMMNDRIMSIPVYELEIQCDDLLTPNIKIPFSNFKDNIDMLAATLNVIIKRNVEDDERDESEIIINEYDIRSIGKKLGYTYRDFEREKMLRMMDEIKQKEINEKKNFKYFFYAIGIYLLFGLLFFIYYYLHDIRHLI